jgi:hypothetical protein
MSKAKCLDCEDILESKHRHHFVKCKCGNSFIDGGDDYFRGGGSIWPLPDEELKADAILNDEFYAALDRDEVLQKLIENAEMEDMFGDDGFLDDYDDYNLGYQAGTLDERERILRGMQKLEDQSHATRTPLYQDTMFSEIRKIINGTA